MLNQGAYGEHVDTNFGDSVVLALGHYTGGNLRVGHHEVKGLNHWVRFDANVPHEVLPYHGVRKSITLFVTKRWHALTPKDLKWLAQRGFNCLELNPRLVDLALSASSDPCVLVDNSKVCDHGGLQEAANDSDVVTHDIVAEPVNNSEDLALVGVSETAVNSEAFTHEVMAESVDNSGATLGAKAEVVGNTDVFGSKDHDGTKEGVRSCEQKRKKKKKKQTARERQEGSNKGPNWNCMPDSYVDYLLFDVLERTSSYFLGFFKKG
eukprot:6492193-Amphidinium_carterae.1